LDGAGKSTLMQSLTEGNQRLIVLAVIYSFTWLSALDESDEDEEPLATIGYSTRTLSVGRYNVTMTEVGGGNDIRGIWPKYFAQVEKAILAYSFINMCKVLWLDIHGGWVKQ
jgi:GTPase SAR1 family protein